MTKKEEQPKRDDRDLDRDKNLPYDPEITEHDKDILNNQSQDEEKGENFKDRQESVDYAGADLDLPGDHGKFNQTANEPQETEKERRPKESANSNDNIESQSETVYKGEKAEKYRDPSEETRNKEDEK